MGCCNKTSDTKLKQSFNSLKSIENLNVDGAIQTNAIFSGFWGKLLYFIILMLVAISPIVNLAALYVFYIAVYGKNKNKNVIDAKEYKNSDETE